jgi:predicted amidophosphoribosyltransferase
MYDNEFDFVKPEIFGTMILTHTHNCQCGQSHDNSQNYCTNCGKENTNKTMDCRQVIDVLNYCQESTKMHREAIDRLVRYFEMGESAGMRVGFVVPTQHDVW